MRNRIFIDTETTGVSPKRRIWDVGVVIHGANGGRREESYLVKDVDLSGADFRTLEYGHFATRHPLAGGTPETGTDVLPEKDVAERIFQIAYGATVGGIVVNFDTEGLAAMLRRHNLCWPSWHHLLCAESQALGALAAHAAHVPAVAEAHADLLQRAEEAPGEWKTDEIAAAFGIPPLDPSERHTAIGDARLAERIYWASIIDRVVPLPDVRWEIPTLLQAVA